MTQTHLDLRDRRATFAALEREVLDLLVIGGGNAGICAAITAREAGASVLLVEHAPKHFRGGNSRHTRNLRAMHRAPTPVLTEAYDEEEYFQDLLRVTKGKTNEPLARLAIRESQDSVAWLLRPVWHCTAW